MGGVACSVTGCNRPRRDPAAFSTRPRDAAALCVAYSYAASVIREQWPHVAAMAGALLVRGTLSGVQLSSLIERQRQAHHIRGRRSSEHLATGGESSTGKHAWWEQSAIAGANPFVYGMLWSMFAWPAAERKIVEQRKRK